MPSRSQELRQNTEANMFIGGLPEPPLRRRRRRTNDSDTTDEGLIGIGVGTISPTDRISPADHKTEERVHAYDRVYELAKKLGQGRERGEPSSIPKPHPPSSAHPLFQVVQAPEPLPSEDPEFAQLTTYVFLSGSITRRPSWHDALSQHLSDLPVTILNPLRADWDSSWVEDITDARFKGQVEWELEAIEKADVVACFFAPGTQAAVSLLEFGLGIGDRKKKVVACAPKGYWKLGNVQVVCQRYGVKFCEGLEEFLVEVRKVVE